MPDGTTHARIHKIGFIPVALFSSPLAISNPIDWALIQAGYALGAFIDPDLDQISITQAEGRAMRHFGCLGAVWVAYWIPYGYILTHRGKLSHLPFLSTLIRLVYVSVPLWILAFLVQRYLNYPLLDWFIYYSKAYLPVWFGLSLADFLHWSADMWPKKRKTVKKFTKRIRGR